MKLGISIHFDLSIRIMLHDYMIVLYSNYHKTNSMNLSNRNDKIVYQVMLTH